MTTKEQSVDIDDLVERLLKTPLGDELDRIIDEKTREAAIASPFWAQIVYAAPAFDELKRRFPSYVGSEYDGIIFQPIEMCKDVSRETRAVGFEYVHMGGRPSTDEVLTEMDKRGLRPALYEELLCFEEKYPEEFNKYGIIALGSEAEIDGRRRIVDLWRNDAGQGHLSLHDVDLRWTDSFRFLAVRKNARRASSLESSPHTTRSSAMTQGKIVDMTGYDNRRRIANEAYNAARTARKPVTWTDPETNVTHTVNPPRTIPLPSGFKPLYDKVDDDYAQATFEPIYACKGVPVETNPEKFVLLKPYDLCKEPHKMAILEQLKARGLRPATHEELERYKGPRDDFDAIVALGSTTCERAGFLKEYVPILKFEYPENILGIMAFFSDPVATLAGSCGVLAVKP